ncbi:MAG: aldo/keto reductase [Chlamydiales bacterium]|nr:aldo/keto reductase [Chlamydiales bacterium]
MLKKRKLGSCGLVVSELGLGCMGMSQMYGTPDNAESISTIHHAIDKGVTFFDTAEMYGPYTNEELLGKALKGNRDKVVIATKFGFRIDKTKAVTGLTSDPKHIVEAVNGSLSRLGVECIDLLYQHRVDPNVPIEDVVGVMATLVQNGKVRFLGLSEAGSDTIRRAHAVHPISCIQSEYSLWERNLEAEIIPLLRSLDIGLVPFCPLGRGFLTGKAKRAEEHPEGDFRRAYDPRLQGKNFDENMKMAQVVFDIAKKKQAHPAQIALAWLLQQGDDIVPIPGTKHRNYLDENLAAADLILTQEEIKILDQALPLGRTSGARYIPQHLSLIDR